MAMNIKSEEAHRLASELAQTMGVSLTEAVTIAVREKLAKYETPRQRAERALALGRDCASRMSEETKSLDVDKELYDTNGMPR